MAIYANHYEEHMNESIGEVPNFDYQGDYVEWEDNDPSNKYIGLDVCSKLPSRQAVFLQICNTAVTFIGILSTINMFRGYWFLTDVYFGNNYESPFYEISLIHGQLYGALVLMVCFAGCSLHAGIFRDEFTGSKCLLDFYYMSYFYIKVIYESIGVYVFQDNIKFFTTKILIS